MVIVFPESDGLYQQNNATCHMALRYHRVVLWGHYDTFKVISWPSNSIDMSQIEHLYSHSGKPNSCYQLPSRNMLELYGQLVTARYHIHQTARHLFYSINNLSSTDGFEIGK
ncbi:hypothetical protein TNCV_3080351 [Trichonephila clavipes]|nr:hypothetical protein TNCV_3080351 [Trichonephila clavipes]